MLSKNQIKLIKSLHQKKYRYEHNLFMAEGSKIVSELLNSAFKIAYLVTTESWKSKNKSLFEAFSITPYLINEDIYNSISTLSNPDMVMVIAEMPNQFIDNECLLSTFTLFLDKIKDPGNMGTIIRTADWFGIKQVLCSPECVDIYSPKVIQSTMGSFLRVNVVENIDYTTLHHYQKSVPIYGMCLMGENIYNSVINTPAIIVIGSESHGISIDLQPFINNKITIPRFCKQTENSSQPESLNAAIATAIICSEINRNSLKHKKI